MSDEIKNAGSKGLILWYSFIALLLFVILVVSIYYANFDYIPEIQR
ncbi:MAG: hypothetical protein AAFU67_07040 [Bacteroidota bacterium]